MNRKERLKQNPVPDRVWQKLGIYLFELYTKDYLCIVDYYSEYPEVSLLEDKTAS